eukprot:scaffold1475_cov167-Amphora_coffeaeformis.AAC.2
MELHSTDRAVKVDAVKKVIASMTVGKDVSMLFTDVLNCVQTGNIELKKLVYLYLINYAKTQPELTLLAVNTFVKDASDANPLIRALAVRTMGCIRVDRITEYLCEPLSRALRDDDPYVRKTAAVCVAKLYDINPELVVERGFLEVLHDLISDSNPSVVANGVAALSEIAETSGKDVMKISASVLQKLLAALNECTEWGQVFILDSLAKYTPADGREAEGIIERVTPRLQHANSAVVMSAVKLSYMELMGSANSDSIRHLTRKLAPPLVTLLNSEPEIQYVALRNINLIVQKRPHILENEIKVFFCKYNDPIYVKMEKLEIIIKLVTEKNIDQVLLELKEYATEVDVDFVRKAVSAIGRCAVKLERAAERCIGVLLELIQTKNPEDTQDMVQRVLDLATEESDNPDLRDRGFIYWRLLSTDPEAAKMVVLGDKPVIEDDTFKLDPSLLNILIGQIATLSSIYHKPPEAFVVRRGAGGAGGDDDEDEEEEEDDEDDNAGGGVDLLDIGGMSLGGGGGGTAAGAGPAKCPMNKVCGPEKSGGLEVYAGFQQVRKKIRMVMEVVNVSSPSSVQNMAVQLNKNSFGLAPATQQIVMDPPVGKGSRGTSFIELNITPNMLAPIPSGQPASPQIQVAIKNMHSGQVFYFAANFNFEALFSPDGAMERSSFIESWKSIDDRNELYGTVSDLPPDAVDIDHVQQKFKGNNVYFIARRPVPNAEGQEVVYFSMRTFTGMEFLAELTFKHGVNACKVCLKTENSSYGLLAKQAIESLLRN